MNKAILMAPVLLLLAAVMTSIEQRAYADDPSYTQGYNVAKFDFLHNRAYDDSCSPNNGDAFCAGYKVGYYAGWHAADLLYGSQYPHQ
jgi:hypothetical protein